MFVIVFAPCHCCTFIAPIFARFFFYYSALILLMKTFIDKSDLITSWDLASVEILGKDISLSQFILIFCR